MPAFVPVALSYALPALGVGALATAVAVIGSTVLVGGLEQRRAKKKASDAYNAAQVDRLANVVTTVGQRELVLGRVRKGGPVTFRGSAGQNKTTFLMHIALAGHEIDGVERIYLNDEPVDIDAQGYVQTEPYAQVATRPISAGTVVIPAGATSATIPGTGTIIEPVSGVLPGVTDTSEGGGTTPDQVIALSLAGRTVSMAQAQPRDVVVNYATRDTASFARIWWDLGGPNAVADERTKQLFPELWGDAHRGRGVARLFVEFTYSDSAFPSGMPTVTAVVRGARVYDPRTGSTAWSDNPALLARHVYTHPYFGKATSVSAAEDARIAAAANACDTSQAWNVGGTSDTLKLYRAGLVASYGAPARDVLDDLATAMGGAWAFAGGELYLRAGVYTAPVLTLTDADLAVVQRDGESESQEPLGISVHRERAQKFNTVNLRIWDAGQDYKQVALTPVKPAALVARDGAELAQEMTLAAVSFAPQAQHIAGIMLRDARDPLTIEAPFKLRAWPLELFDTVSLTLARYGWSAKTFMVMRREWDRARGVIKLTLKETSAAIYSPDASFLPQGFAQNTALPRVWDIQPPALAAIYSGTAELQRSGAAVLPTVRVVWAALADSSVTSSGSIEVQWRPHDAEQWQTVRVDGTATQAVLQGVTEGQAIAIRLRARNPVAASDWSAPVLHVVVGKTEPPSDVASFTVRGQTLEWSQVGDADLAGYRLRFNYGQNVNWGAAAPLHDGLVTDSPWTPERLPSGPVTLLVKAVDTSGNESANAAVILTQLGDVVLDNLILTADLKAAGFPGERTNAAVAGGNLAASDAGGLFWGAAGGSFWAGADSAAYWPTATYLAMEYVASHTVTSVEAGARLTVDAAVAAESYSLEYRYDTQGAHWGREGDFYWGADSTAFWPEPTQWVTWPGALDDVAAGRIQLRVRTQAGQVQGVISALALRFDVPDETEELDNVAISAAGTRLPITKLYRAINNVQLTLQNAGAAIAARWIDKSTAGPLVVCVDAAGTQVSGVVDARVQGVKA